MRQEPFKDTTDFVFCWPSTAGHVPLRIASFPSETPLEKTKCSFASGYQLEIASGLGMEVCAHFSFKLWDPICYRSLSSYKHQSCAFKGLVFLVSSNPSSSYILSVSSSEGFPEPQREGFDGDILFRTECSKALFRPLCVVWLWVSLYLFPSAAGGSSSDNS